MPRNSKYPMSSVTSGDPYPIERHLFKPWVINRNLLFCILKPLIHKT